MTEIIEDEEKGESKEVYKYLAMEGFARLVHEYAYMIAEQLYDNLGGR